jgi:hypothetical protein
MEPPAQQTRCGSRPNRWMQAGTMEKDLFGRPIRKKEPRYGRSLRKYDRDSFDERLARFQYLQTVFPKRYGFLLPLESSYLLHEVKVTFVSGAYVATIMLSQAFIEHVLQCAVESAGEGKVARCGLAEIVKWFQKNRPQHDFLMRKIDDLRRFRNPFTHLRPFDDPDTLGQRIFVAKASPDEILETETKSALALMYQVAITTF